MGKKTFFMYKYLSTVTVEDYRLLNVLIYIGACCTAKYSQKLTEGQYCVMGFDTNSVPLLIMVSPSLSASALTLLSAMSGWNLKGTV